MRFLGLWEAGLETIRSACEVRPIAPLNRVFALEAAIPRRDLPRFPHRRFKRFEDPAADDSRPCSPRFQGYNFARNLAPVGRMRQIADEIRCTPAQFVIAWVIVSGDAIVSIPGTKWPLVP